MLKLLQDNEKPNNENSYLVASARLLEDHIYETDQKLDRIESKLDELNPGARPQS